MGIEQRRHPRYDVRLAVRYANAQQFVIDYVENLSAGGLFIAGAHLLQLGDQTEVVIDLPGAGEWKVAASVVFVLGAEAAKSSGRKPGAGMHITTKPAGFDDALLGYLLRLGRRREHAVIAAELPGLQAIVDAGYRVLPLVPPSGIAAALADETAKVVAVVVAPSQVPAYREHATDRLFSPATPEEITDIIARIDSLL